MVTTTDPGLLPCHSPWCRSVGEIRFGEDWAFCFCETCGAQTEDYETVGEAVAAWNGPPPPVEADLVEALEEIEQVSKAIELCAYASAGDFKRREDTRMYSIWAGTLKRALARARSQAEGG